MYNGIDILPLGAKLLGASSWIGYLRCQSAEVATVDYYRIPEFTKITAPLVHPWILSVGLQAWSDSDVPGVGKPV